MYAAIIDARRLPLLAPSGVHVAAATLSRAASMSQQPYRAAVIGLGFIGAGDQVSGDRLGQKVADLDGTHAEALRRHPRVALVAGSSRDAGRRDRFRERTGDVRTYAEWRELLARETDEGRPLDLVSVATYASQHAEVVEACAERGVRAVYCEKPIAQSVADADRMLEACRRSGTLLAINHNRRFHPAFRNLQAMIAAEELGRLTSIRLQWTTGRLGNVGTHMIDAALMLTGQPIASVAGWLDLTGRPDCRGSDFHDPGGWGVLRFEDGLTCFVDGPDFGHVPFEIAVHGTKGRAAWAAGSLTVWTDGRAPRVLPELPAGRTSMDVAVEELVAWLDGQSPFPYPAEEARQTLEAIVAMHISHERGGINIPLPLHADKRQRIVRSG
jgi:predicted dehydrogenase